MIWLAEFHRQWRAARGSRVKAASRAFSRDWVKLLEAAGITRAEDQKTAEREAVKLEKAGHLLLGRNRYRWYLIETVKMPLSSEPWLIERFGGTASEVLQASALRVIAEMAAEGHARFPEEWEVLIASLRTAFAQGRSVRPFFWTQPESLNALLKAVKKLSETEWPPDAWIRDVSIQLGMDSKGLERHQRTFESGLARLFGGETPLASLGIVGGSSHVELIGPLCLHFADGRIRDYAGESRVLISEEELERCVMISTTAERMLSIENRKTTFRQYGAANRDRRTLIVASSFPNGAFRVLMKKLPEPLVHFHFGDTDAAGWLILLKLREMSARPVLAFRMKFREVDFSRPLTGYDEQCLPRLLESPLLEDVRAEILAMLELRSRGDFEQESLPAPALGGWPF
jgi:Uncharacterized protein conserved in bacteria C-term(DUF2220)